MDLFDLVRNGDVAALKAALADATAPDFHDDTGETPLILAAGLGANEMVDVLLDAGADIQLANDFGFDALSNALWGSHISLAKRLVSRGAKVSVDCAAALGDVKRLKDEWQTMPPIEDTIGAYLTACRAGQTEVVCWFLDREVPVDLHPPGNEWGGIGCPGLHHAAGKGHVGVVRLLLERGADIMLVDDVYGSQPLAWAASGGHEEVVSVLLDAGADPAHHNLHRLTAADLARKNGFDDLAQRLNVS